MQGYYKKTNKDESKIKPSNCKNKKTSECPLKGQIAEKRT